MNRIGSALLRRVNPHFAWSLALLSAFALCVMPAPARAQEDPPARVGRIADIGGDVFHAPEDRASDRATIGLNFPVTTGDNLWVAESGRAEIDFGAGQIRLGARDQRPRFAHRRSHRWRSSSRRAGRSFGCACSTRAKSRASTRRIRRSSCRVPVSTGFARAQASHKLHRNFQGYPTRPECDLVSFGISAIGKIGLRTYSANVKTLDEYYELLERHVLPVKRGYRLTDDDLVRRDAIARLMCDFELAPREIEARHGVRFAEYFAPELAALAPLAADGLVEISPEAIRVTPRGRLLVRSAAMLFYRHLREAAERAKYSKVI